MQLPQLNAFFAAGFQPISLTYASVQRLMIKMINAIERPCVAAYPASCCLKYNAYINGRSAEAACGEHDNIKLLNPPILLYDFGADNK